MCDLLFRDMDGIISNFVGESCRAAEQEKEHQQQTPSIMAVGSGESVNDAALQSVEHNKETSAPDEKGTRISLATMVEEFFTQVGFRS